MCDTVSISSEGEAEIINSPTHFSGNTVIRAISSISLPTLECRPSYYSLFPINCHYTCLRTLLPYTQQQQNSFEKNVNNILVSAQCSILAKNPLPNRLKIPSCTMFQATYIIV